MRVLKFGGTSVGTIQNFRTVIRIIEEKLKREKIIVVVSALSKITDKLLNAVELAGSKDETYRALIAEIRIRHYEFLTSLVADKFIMEARILIDTYLSEIQVKLDSMYHLQVTSPKISDSIVPLGEKLSQVLLHASLLSNGIEAQIVDSSKLISTDSNFTQAEVNYEKSYKQIAEAFSLTRPDVVEIVNGFTGSDKDGNITTLGRSGSDYTATIFGSALDTDVVEIWTDVDGILTADPRLVAEAISLKTLSYQDAAELAFLGAKVIFPKAMEPVQCKNIPVLILNTFQPEFEGTVITHESEDNHFRIKAVTHMENLSLITLNNLAIDSDTHILEKLVRVIRHQNWPSIFFNYSISQRSISLLTHTKKAIALVEEIQERFKAELNQKLIGNINLRNDLCLVSVIGKSNGSQIETMNKIYQTIEINHFKNILFFSCSEGRNHSFLFAETEAQKLVTAIHNTLLNEFIQINVA
jgi:bifunctional aspartokinase / homoserine dehydrogenase 1